MAGDSTLGNLAFWTAVIFAALGMQWTYLLLRDAHRRGVARLRRMHRG